MTFYSELNKFHDNAAFITESGEVYSYVDLLSQVSQMEEMLQSNDKKLLFILCNNNRETVIGYLAALRSNSAVLLLNHAIKPEALDYLILTYKPSFVWGPGHKGIYEYGNYSLTPTKLKRNFEVHPDLKLLLSTSGSTGSPKLVKLSAKNIDANAKAIVSYLNLSQDELPITVLPFSYSYGLSIINSHLKVGAKVLLTSKTIFDKSFWQMFSTYKATSLSGVPYTYEMFKHLKLLSMDLSHVRTMTQAGGKLPLELAEFYAHELRQRNIDFYIMYGQTEATARMSYLPPDRSCEKFGSCGIPIPGGRFEIVDQNKMRINRPNVEGELVYYGDNVMMGYAESEQDLSVGDELQGVLYTGDLAKFDEDHFYYITGRNKRFLKIFGDRINLNELEQYLKDAIGHDCACGGKDNMLCIAIEVDFVKDQISDIIQNRFNIHHSAYKIITVDAIARNESGKIKYSDLFSSYL